HRHGGGRELEGRRGGERAAVGRLRPRRDLDGVLGGHGEPARGLPPLSSVFPSGSKSSVLVPTQRQRPGGCGVSLAGIGSFSSSAYEVTGTIGWLNVSETCGASGTSPSGM